MTSAVSHVRMAVYSLGAGKAWHKEVCVTSAFWLLRVSNAEWHLRQALAELNRAGHPPRSKAQVMRMLNWVRAEQRRAA